jgi:hypothetical protein
MDGKYATCSENLRTSRLLLCLTLLFQIRSVTSQTDVDELPTYKGQRIADSLTLKGKWPGADRDSGSEGALVLTRFLLGRRTCSVLRLFVASRLL